MRTSRFRYGQIVLASFHDKRRTTKNRPVVIIDDDGDYEVTGLCAVQPMASR